MFRFKQFTIHQDRTPMKVGTDGVLLGAWVGVKPTDRHILDVGTGTGLIALMLAQRTSLARIVGVDIDSVEQATENAAESPWGDRLCFLKTPIQDYQASELFDLVVSNPPYFLDSLQCEDKARTTARHAVSLSFAQLGEAALRLLRPQGRLAVVLPVDEGRRFVAENRLRFDLVRRCAVRTTPRRAPKRVLMELVRHEVDCPTVEESELIIGTGQHEEYTPQYRSLTGDFYLKF